MTGHRPRFAGGGFPAMRRVVVTGLGVLAPNGIGKEAFWSACVAGRSGIGPIRSFDASAAPVKVAGEVPACDLAEGVPEEHRKSLKVMGRAAGFAAGAAGLGIRDSGLNWPREDPERVGVVMGTGLVPMALPALAPLLAGAIGGDGAFHAGRLAAGKGAGLFPLEILKYLPNMAAAHVSLAFNAQGPNSTVTTACVAGTQAVGEVARLITRGEAARVLAGGADSRIDPLLVHMYAALGTVSLADRPAGEISRPFDRLRDGFVLGEGAGVLVLEELERAKRRGAVRHPHVL